MVIQPLSTRLINQIFDILQSLEEVGAGDNLRFGRFIRRFWALVPQLRETGFCFSAQPNQKKNNKTFLASSKRFNPWN